MGRRRKLREKVVQLLYQAEVGKSTPEEVLESFRHEENPDDEGLVFVKERLFGVREHLEKLDEIITQHAKNWKLNRIALIDKNILRLAAFEMLYLEDIPHVVAINEAVDIAKKFSTADSGKFVNGILDKIKNDVVEKGPKKSA